MNTEKLMQSYSNDFWRPTVQYQRFDSLWHSNKRSKFGRNHASWTLTLITGGGAITPAVIVTKENKPLHNSKINKTAKLELVLDDLFRQLIFRFNTGSLEGQWAKINAAINHVKKWRKCWNKNKVHGIQIEKNIKKKYYQVKTKNKKCSRYSLAFFSF